MKYKILRTAKAEEQLRSIILYIADDSGSEDIALEYLKKLETAINYLGDFPAMGTIPRYATLRRKGYRALLAEQHLVFYKIDESKKEVMIHAILDKRREYVNLI